ncbi:MAG: prolipoprotein diacylglyceryl transferase [Vulcanimicrobiota bacterium]
MKPVLFELGNLKIYSYGVMMVVGYLAALLFNYKNAHKAKLSRDEAIDITIYIFFSGLIGSRLVYILLNLEKYIPDWKKMFAFNQGGLSWHGGFLGAGICIYLFCKIKKIKVLPVADLLFTTSILGLALGRIGCFLNGCCYGKACSLPWAVTFPSHRHPIPVHPTQLYEMFLDLIIFAFLLYWLKKRKFWGENTMMTFASYSVVRFIVEFYRFNEPNQMIHGLSLAQWFSIGLFTVMAAGIVWLRAHTPENLIIDHDSLKPEEQEKTRNKKENSSDFPGDTGGETRLEQL